MARTMVQQYCFLSKLPALPKCTQQDGLGDNGQLKLEPVVDRLLVRENLRLATKVRLSRRESSHLVRPRCAPDQLLH